ncbi:MAG: hypothetical protein ACKVT0_22785 [Planctomycetaceae bacterium]
MRRENIIINATVRIGHYCAKHPVIAVMSGFVLFILILIYRHFMAEYRLIQLLNGSRDIEITKLVITGHQIRVEIDNSEVCRYLSEAMRDSRKMTLHPAVYYGIELTFSDGGEYWVACDVFSNGISFSIPADDPIDAGIPTRSVYFKEKPPIHLRKVWDILLDHNLRTPYYGRVLRIPNEGKPNFTNEDSARAVE